MRVLVAGGTAVVVDAGGDVSQVNRKQGPANINQWTHDMRDPSNNAVAHDRAIPSLRHLQRDGMAVAAGRLFVAGRDGTVQSFGSR